MKATVLSEINLQLTVAEVADLIKAVDTYETDGDGVPVALRNLRTELYSCLVLADLT